MRNGDTFLFGSESKAILAHGEYRVQLNPAGLLEYFTFQNFFTEQTLFDGVKLLPAGSILTVDISAGTVSEPRLYWDYEFTEPEQAIDENEYLEELRSIILSGCTPTS